LKEQDFNDFEIIVVDNNSIDRTVEIAKKFGAILVSEKNQGGRFVSLVRLGRRSDPIPY
jgi:glycosyltransferase involved in cell wall biosynthesis